MSTKANDLRNKLNEALAIEITEEQFKGLLLHLRHVLEWNEKINLTSITEERVAVILHIEDSLRALPLLEAAPKGDIADIGTGAGYPGVPLAIMSGRSCALVEARSKKAFVLDEFIKISGLEKQLRTYALRAEEFSRLKKGAHAVVTARALSGLSSIMELASPLLDREGLFIAYKGKISDDELEAARVTESLVGLRKLEHKEYTLSDGTSQRSLIVFEKYAEPKVRLPRRTGMAQNNPLGVAKKSQVMSSREYNVRQEPSGA